MRTVSKTRKRDMRMNIESTVNDLVNKAIDEKIGGAILAQQEVMEMVKSTAIEEIKNYLPAKKIELVIKPSDRVVEGQHRHEIFEEVFRSIQCGNVCLVGPAGSGKTTLAAQIAEALGIPFEFTGAIDSPYKLTGFIDAQGRTVKTSFRRAYEKGGLFLFDEIDASLPGAVLAFNAALANDQMDFPDGVVKRHPNFYCMAAANTFWTGGDRVYVGRNQMDGASLDRFIFIEMGYDENLERALAQNDEWVDFVQRVRVAVKELKERHIVSPRASITGAKLLAAGMAQELVERSVLFKGLGKDKIRQIREKMAPKPPVQNKKKEDEASGWVQVYKTGGMMVDPNFVMAPSIMEKIQQIEELEKKKKLASSLNIPF